MDIPKNWRLQNQRYQLIGTVCNSCGDVNFPPLLVCKECKSRDLSEKQFSGNGSVYSFTTVYQAAEAFADYLPFVVALIDLEEGTRITAQLTDVDPDSIEIGMPVEMVIRKISEDGEKGVINYGYKFRPIFSSKI